MTTTQGIVSADDHVTAHPRVWADRLPRKYLDTGPRVVREVADAASLNRPGEMRLAVDEKTADFWVYEDYKRPLLLGENAAGFALDDMQSVPMTYEEIRQGCYEPRARLADMDVAGVEASICFPNFFPRFAGQIFLDAKDKDLALLCVQAYNDWMLDEWCAGSGGRLIPLGILPLWDLDLCAQETDRVGPRGMRAFTFSEAPARLGLPSIQSRGWDPFFARCEEWGIVVAMHIGSAPSLQDPSPDVPAGVSTTLLASNSAAALIDWLFAGVFVRFPHLKACLAESQIGWIPYFLERADRVWEHNRGWNGVWGVIPDPPSSYFANHLYCTFFEDKHGLESIDKIGVDNVLFEVDYPHSDSNWPTSLQIAQDMTAGLAPDVAAKVIRDNARTLFRLV